MLTAIKPTFAFRSFAQISPALDKSTNSLIFDRSKCVICRSCVKTCSTVSGQNVLAVVEDDDGNTVISTASGLPLQETNCIKCGQCTLACGPGAISEKDQIPEVEKVFKHLDGRIPICQIAPAVRANIGEALGLKPGTVTTGRLVTALKMLGFQYVFDTNFGADLTIVEEASELVQRLQKDPTKLPMFTSCCPAWVNYVEQSDPELMKLLSTCRSPMGMQSALMKSEFPKAIGTTPDKIYNVAIMPCVAKKDEATRDQLRTAEGVRETDCVLSVRELAKWIKKKKINFKTLTETKFDEPYGTASGAGAIFAATGGVMEAAIRTAYSYITGRSLENLEYTPVRGHDGVKVATVNIEGNSVTFAVAHGIANAKKLIKRIRDNDPDLAMLRFVEVMACPGGCVCGGGSPRAKTKKVMDARLQAIYTIDKYAPIRESHKNPQIVELYKRIGGKPGDSHFAHEHFHTQYRSHPK